MEERKAYYAVIPATIRYDDNLKDKAKLLYGEITALTNEKGFCWATNSYFADLYKVTKETVSRLLKNLSDNGYIRIQLVYKNKQIIGRKIYIETSIPIDKNINTYCENTQEPIDENDSYPIDQKVKENNTSINNTINNTLDKKKKTDFDELIDGYTENINLRKNIYEFIKMRKGVKAAITTLGLKKILNKLDTLAKSDNEKIAILDNSIMNSWKGIFPINKQNNISNKNEKPPLRFNNFEAREYDYDSLEKKLLGWDAS